jgi:hypothetical protein
MSSKITINSVTLSAVPDSNITCTVSYRLKNAVSWTQRANNVAVQPNGSLVAPLEIPALADDTEYDIWAYNNCGGAGTVVTVKTPAP